jgi:hypothetical protein
MLRQRRFALIRYGALLACIVCSLAAAVISSSGRRRVSFEQRYLIAQPTNDLDRYVLKSREAVAKFLGGAQELTNIEQQIERRFPLERLASKSDVQLGRLADRLLRESHWDEAYSILYYQALRKYEKQIQEKEESVPKERWLMRPSRFQPNIIPP